MKGLEPPRLSAPDPKSGAAANYATSACDYDVNVNIGTLLAANGVYPDSCRGHIRM